MKISELKAGQGKVDITAVVKSKEEPRTFNKYGKDLRVAKAIVEDESGNITLSLWNDDIDTVNVGSTIKITNGYVSEFNGEKQLTSGKFGKLEVVDNKEQEKESEDIKVPDTKGKKKKEAAEYEEVPF